MEALSQEVLGSDLILAWRHDPELFCRQVLNMALWGKQREILRSLMVNHETMVPSCNAAGKTEIAAAAVLWWLMTRESKVVTTAPTWRQVKNVLWGRIHSLIAPRKDLLGAEVLSTLIRINPDWEAIGLATTDPSKFQGFHSPGGVLIVVDEAGGVDNPELWAAIDGCLTGENDRLLAIGNPTTTTGEFYRRSTRTGPGKKVIPISAFDVPNVQQKKRVVNGLVSWAFVERKRSEWGEDSPMWQSRILGQFPKTGSDSLYPLAWLERAFEGRPVSGGHRVLSMDVARKGDDSNALCVREGGTLKELTVWSAPDTTDSVNRFLGAMRRWSPQVARIDAVGLGGPMLDQARAAQDTDKGLGGTVLEGFVASQSPYDTSLFANLKAEAYFHFRSLLEQDRVDLSALPQDLRATVERQATAIKYEYNSNGKLKIEDKQAMRVRKGFSPDELEAIIMAYWEPQGLPVDADAVGDYDFSLGDADDVATFEYDYERFALV